MAAFRFWVCLIILLVSFTGSIARPLPPISTLPTNTMAMQGSVKLKHSSTSTLPPVKDKDDMIGQVKEMFKGRMQREDVIRSYYVSDRVSPGGPDPHHH